MLDALTDLRKRTIWCDDFDGTEDYRRWCYKKGGGSAPAAPDPAETARAQGLANKEAVHESAKVNQINKVTPFGNEQWTGEIGAPDRTVTQTLTPDVQGSLDAQNQIARYLSEFGEEFVPRSTQPFEQEFNLEGLPAAPQGDDAARQRIEQAMFDRLQPQMDRQRDAQYTQLSNQGINFGDEAYKNAVDDLNRSENDLRLGVTAQGGQEMSNLFNLGTQARQQGINERILERSQPLNELSALLQGAPAAQLPQFGQAAQYNVNPADRLGAEALSYQGALNNYNTQQASSNAKMGGLAGLGGALGGAGIMKYSDERLKTDIKRVGYTDDGLPVYTYRMKAGGPVEMGVMAQDVEKVRPELVTNLNGYKAVHYEGIC